MPFIIQALDHDEGSGARWFDLKNATHETRANAVKQLHRIRATDPEDCSYSYRITEKYSREYYAQPTDKLEY